MSEPFTLDAVERKAKDIHLVFEEAIVSAYTNLSEQLEALNAEIEASSLDKKMAAMVVLAVSEDMEKRVEEVVGA